MYRTVVAGLAVAFLGALGLLWWSQVAPPSAPPGRVAVAGHRTAASVAWAADRPLTHLNADTEPAAARALGLAHGLRHAWSMALWRQTARGRLSRWLSESGLAFDRHARRMGWARTAQAHVAALPPADRAWLAAYAAGVNAAFETDYVRTQRPFAALGEAPAPWAPWHTLAVEHLLTWMATDLPALPDTAASALHPAADSLRAVDDTLRHWLGLHGWSDAMAWAIRPGPASPVHIGARWPRGSSTDALIAPVWHTTPSDTAWIATVPGTRWTLAHHTRTATRVQLPRARATWQPLAASDTIQRVTERLRQRDGHELLVRSAFTERGRVLGEAGPVLSPDTVSRSDSLRSSPQPAPAAWVLTLPHRQSVPAHAQRFPDPAPMPHHTPRTLTHATALTTQGPAQAVVPAQGDSAGVVLSDSPWRPAWARRLADYTDGAPSIHTWAVDDTSTWARQAVAPLQDALAAALPADSLSQAAAAFVQNWDGVFAPSSIGASLFQAWWEEIQPLRRSPTQVEAMPFFASMRYRRAFVRAVYRLRRSYGANMQQWRWEAVEPHRFRAPLWGDPTRRPGSVYPAAAHPAPVVSIPGRGHISTLAPGADPSASHPAAGYHLFWGAAGAPAPYYRSTDLARTLADRLMEAADARPDAHRPSASPDVRVVLTAP